MQLAMKLGEIGEVVPRVYTVCFFTPGAVVPWVKLIDAGTDIEAIDIAQCMNPNAMREVWDRHRLVKVIPAVRNARAGISGCDDGVI